MWKPNRTPVRSANAPAPPPFLSQAIVAGNMIYCSGQVGVNPSTGKMVEGPIQERTVCFPTYPIFQTHQESGGGSSWNQKQVLQNLRAVLEAGGSSVQDVVKVNIFLADMGDFAAVNEVYDSFFTHPKPARTCVAVKTLPLGTDVEIECTGIVLVPSASAEEFSPMMDELDHTSGIPPVSVPSNGGDGTGT
ncbi:hypothetical protein BBP40_009042 [Aspergillus hancockii]|nr:hypothetical protein BBP40_009042 [Aspergillus hancockii]